MHTSLVPRPDEPLGDLNITKVLATAWWRGHSPLMGTHMPQIHSWNSQEEESVSLLFLSPTHLGLCRSIRTCLYLWLRNRMMYLHTQLFIFNLPNLGDSGEAENEKLKQVIQKKILKKSHDVLSLATVKITTQSKILCVSNNVWFPPESDSINSVLSMSYYDTIYFNPWKLLSTTLTQNYRLPLQQLSWLTLRQAQGKVSLLQKLSLVVPPSMHGRQYSRRM